jgi:hypothetical protein
MKKTVFYIVSASILAIALLYYSNYNSADYLKNLKGKIDRMIVASNYEFADSHESEIADINRNLDQNIIFKAAIKQWFRIDFIVRWRKSHKLDLNTTKTLILQNDSFFNPLILSVKGKAGNQLVCVLLIAVLIIVFLYLALNSSLLRDIVGEDHEVDVSDNKNIEIKAPFSLSRTQIAIWITFIASIYIHAIFWRQCTDISINTTALIMMGISAGTLATGTLLDISEIEAGIVRTQNEPSSGNFFIDILSDSSGISIHRFQNVVWTVVAIIIYIYRYNNANGPGCLPELDYTLVALTGISSATYLTLKNKENLPSTTTITQATFHLVPDWKMDPAILSTFKASDLDFQILKVTVDGVDLAPIMYSDSKLDFKLTNLKPVSHSITIEGKAKINGIEALFKGLFNGLIDNRSTLPISIKMSKAD